MAKSRKRKTVKRSRGLSLDSLIKRFFLLAVFGTASLFLLSHLTGSKNVLGTSTSAATYEIRGYAFLDNDANGLWSSGDKKAAGVTIKKEGNKHEQITTTSTGYYKFFKLPASGDYKLTYEAPTYIIMNENPLWNIELPPSKTVNVVLRRGSLAGFVYQEKDGVPGLTAGDKRFSGVTVLKNGDKWESTKTNANGYYRFFNLPPKTGYMLEVVKPSGYTNDSPGFIEHIEINKEHINRKFNFTLKPYPTPTRSR